MPKFFYRAKDKDGNDIEGKEEAASRYLLARTLKERGYIVTSIQDSAEKKGTSFVSKILAGINKVSLKERILFANNVSAMISAGLSLSRSLEIMKKQTKNEKLKQTLVVLSDDVARGVAFHEALAKFPETFPPIFVAMVKTGEESGRLPESLQLVRDQLTKTYELRRKIRGAMVYPAVVITLIVAITIVMMLFVVPTIKATFEGLGVELPRTTRLVIGASDFVAGNIVYLPFVLALLGITFVRFKKTARGKRTIAWFVLHAPITREISREANAALAMRTLSSLISAGVTLTTSLEITGEVLTNPYGVDVVSAAEKDVQKGVPLSAAFIAGENIFPPLVAEMIEVGEETGKLSEMLLRGALFYEGEVDAKTKNLSTLIEPLLMVVVGLAVGFFAVSMIQPIYSLSDVI